MISQQDVIKAIDAADVHFSWCWERLRKFKRYDLETQDLVDFQIRLTEAFVKLDRAYRAIKSEQGYLIGRKSRYQPRWFSARMGKLDRYLSAIKEAIGIGRSLGDGFAWIFYRNEAVLLEEHSREQRQLLLPPNVGGLGERAFLEKMQGLGGMFVLYHAITSFLRLGDFSFFDPQTGRITTIGELKTRHVGGDTYNITVGFVAGAKDNPFVRQAEEARKYSESEPAPYELLDEVTERKLKQQVNQIAKALQRQESSVDDVKIKTQANFHFETLQDVVQQSNIRSFGFGRAGAGLVLGAWRPRRSGSLGQRLFRKSGNIENIIGPARNAAEQVLDPNLTDNCLFLGSFGSHESGFPAMLSGGLPLMWWPLEDSIFEDVIFGHVIVITMFNPAQLWALLRERGFVLATNDRSQVTRIYRQIDDKRFEIGNFKYFEHLVQHALMDEMAVVGMIEASAKQAVVSAGGKPLRVNLRPRLRV